MTEPSESRNPHDHRHEAEIADDQLLDAILRGRTQDTEPMMNVRVARVMDRVASMSRATTPESFPKHAGRGSHLISAGRAIAAAVLIGAMIALMLVVSRPQPAQATLLERAIQRMGAEDLTYSITVVADSDAAIEKRSSLERKGSHNRHPGSRAFAWKRNRDDQGRRTGGRPFNRLDGATLHTRGELWALLIPVRPGKVYARGFDGQTAWNNHDRDDVRAKASSQTAADDRASRPRQILEMVTLDLSEMIVQLDRGYDVSEPESVDSQLDGSTLIRYVAARRSGTGARSPNRPVDRRTTRRTGADPRRSSLPHSIEIWADPESERVVFLRLAGLRSPASEEMVDLELALQSTDSIPDDVFSRSAHSELAPSRRPVERPSGDRRRDLESERGRSPDRPGRR